MAVYKQTFGDNSSLQITVHSTPASDGRLPRFSMNVIPRDATEHTIGTGSQVTPAMREAMERVYDELETLGLRLDKDGGATIGTNASTFITEAVFKGADDTKTEAAGKKLESLGFEKPDPEIAAKKARDKALDAALAAYKSPTELVEALTVRLTKAQQVAVA